METKKGTKIQDLSGCCWHFSVFHARAESLRVKSNLYTSWWYLFLIRKLVNSKSSVLHRFACGDKQTRGMRSDFPTGYITTFVLPKNIIAFCSFFWLTRLGMYEIYSFIGLKCGRDPTFCSVSKYIDLDFRTSDFSCCPLNRVCRWEPHFRDMP